MISLRELRESDADDLVLACNDPLTRLYVPSLPSPYTFEHALWWVRRGVGEVRAKGGVVWAIADAVSDRLLGSVGLQRDSLGYWVAPGARGRGVATEATRRGVRWAFDQGYARVELSTREENAASQRVALAAGFRYEGVRRAAERGRDGGRYDMMVWSRLPGDPPGPTSRLIPDLPGGELSDGVIILCPTGPEDAEDVYALRVLPDVVAANVLPEAPTMKDVMRRCQLAPAAWLTRDSVDMTIVEADTGEFVGELGFFYQEPLTGQAMIGYSVLPAFRGRGYAARAVELIADWAFGCAGVRRLVAGTRPDNLASQRVLTKSGFCQEGYLRARLPGPNGTRIDDLLWARLPHG